MATIESGVVDFLVDRFRRSAYFVDVIREVQLQDIYGHRVRCDLGLVGYLPPHGHYLVLVECKRAEYTDLNKFNFLQTSKTVAEALAQVVHYKDLCLAVDERLPQECRHKSARMAFGGVFLDDPKRSHHVRVHGMSILTAKTGVGIVSYRDYSNQVNFRLGEAFIFRDYGGEMEHHVKLDQYLFGSVKRCGSRRRDRQTVAERFDELRLANLMGVVL